MLLASLALRYVTQQNGKDPLVVQLELADRCFCRKLMTILAEGEDFLSLTHEPRRLTRRAELSYVLSVGGSISFRQQDAKRMSQDLIAAISTLLRSASRARSSLSMPASSFVILIRMAVEKRPRAMGIYVVSDPTDFGRTNYQTEQ